MKLYIVTFLVSLSLLGCKDNSSTEHNHAFFGGEIINPSKAYVVLNSPQLKQSDTIFLDNKNRFIHKITNFKPGLYKFVHDEYQMLVIEPNDSIMIRLNTFDFDESLVFTGKGSKKNNFLIKEFLQNEKETKKRVKYCQMDPESYDRFMTEKVKIKLDVLHSFLEKDNSSELFKSIAEARINYNFYADKEIYPFIYFGNNKLVHVKDLPEDFYNYRNDIDFEADHLSDEYSYNFFLSWYFNNIALEEFYKTNSFHSKFNRHSVGYNLEKMKLIDSLITHTYIKNNLLKYATQDFINKSDNENNSQKIIDYYLANSTDEIGKTYIVELASSLEKILPGKIMPNIKVLNFDREVLDLNTIINDNHPTIIYFWASNLKMMYRNSHYKSTKIKAKFPNVNFISINVNDITDEYWNTTIHKFKFPIETEFKFKYPEKALKTLAINSVTKVFLLDKNNIIIEANGNLFSNDLIKKLKKL